MRSSLGLDGEGSITAPAAVCDSFTAVQTEDAAKHPKSELGHSRHFDGLPMTFGLPPEADISTASRHVSKVPGANIVSLPRHVRLVPSTEVGYSITSSARASNDGENSRPITFATLRFTTRSNSVGCSTGRSMGFAPCRILSTYSAARRNKFAVLGPYDINPPLTTYSRKPCMVGSRRSWASLLIRMRFVFTRIFGGTYMACN